MKNIIVLLIGLIMFMVHDEAKAQPKMQYGFVEAHVTCYPEDREEYTALVLSQVFNYCTLGIGDGVVLMNDQTLIDKAAEKVCGVSNYIVTWRNLYHNYNRSQLNNTYSFRQNQKGYSMIVTYFSLAEAMFAKNCE